MPTALHLGGQARKCEGEAGARVGLVSRPERLLGGSRAQEGVWGLAAYAPISGIGHVVMQVWMIFVSDSDCLDL